MTDKIEIALAQPEDAETLADISKRSFDSDVAVGASGPGGPDGYDSIEVHKRDTKLDRTDYWKFLFNGQIVGGTRVYKGSSEQGYIYGVFVDPAFHRRGIGTQTFALIEQKYPDIKKWTLDTPVWNMRTKQFYEKIGFKQVGILRWAKEFDLRYYVKITDESYHDKTVCISDLRDGMNGIQVIGTIESMSDSRDVTSSKDGKQHKVVNATLLDDTGAVTLVLWNDFIRQINVGEMIWVLSGYVKEYRGTLQLNISKYGTVVIIETSK